MQIKKSVIASSPLLSIVIGQWELSVTGKLQSAMPAGTGVGNVLPTPASTPTPAKKSTSTDSNTGLDSDTAALLRGSYVNRTSRRWHVYLPPLIYVRPKSTFPPIATTYSPIGVALSPLVSPALIFKRIHAAARGACLVAPITRVELFIFGHLFW